jgi:hypothetical protein
MYDLETSTSTNGVDIDGGSERSSVAKRERNVKTKVVVCNLTTKLFLTATVPSSLSPHHLFPADVRVVRWFGRENLRERTQS